ncbi:MAG: hypothetical protein ACI4SR_01135 [Faecalibacillus sp.]
MEVALIIGLFATSALALNFLVGQRTKMAGAMNIINLCLTVAIAYQFDQVKNIIWLFICAAVIVVVFFIVKTFIKRKKSQAKVIDKGVIEGVELIEKKER